MKRILRIYLAATGIIVMLHHHAAAADFCLGFGSYPAFIVLKNFSIPGKGKCKPVAGYERDDHAQLSGTVCTLSDNSAFRVSYNGVSVFSSAGSHYMTSGFFALNRVSLSGVYFGVYEHRKLKWSNDGSALGPPDSEWVAGAATGAKCVAPPLY